MKMVKIGLKQLLIAIICISSQLNSEVINENQDRSKSKIFTKMTNFISKTDQTIQNSKAAVMLKSAQNKLTENFQKMDGDMQRMMVKMDEFFDGYANKVKSSADGLKDFDLKEAGMKLKGTVDEWKSRMEMRFFEKAGLEGLKSENMRRFEEDRQVQESQIGGSQNEGSQIEATPVKQVFGIVKKVKKSGKK